MVRTQPEVSTHLAGITPTEGCHPPHLTVHGGVPDTFLVNTSQVSLYSAPSHTHMYTHTFTFTHAHTVHTLSGTLAQVHA